MSIPSFLENVEWTETHLQPSGELPHATHTGELEVLGRKLRCYRLSDGRAIIDVNDVNALFDDWTEGA